MSQHHENRRAWHDPDLWAWSDQRKCWVRCTDGAIPGDIEVVSYDGRRFYFKREGGAE